MQLAVAGVDAERASRALQQKWQNEASAEQIRAAQHVIDLDAAEIQCPACAATFANPGTSAERICPGCGLYL